MIAIGAWLLFVIGATVLGAAAGRAGLPNYRQGAGDSARAEQILASAHIGQHAAEHRRGHHEQQPRPDRCHAVPRAPAAQRGRETAPW